MDPHKKQSAFVTVKTKYQITLPTHIRKSLQLDVGALLEATQKGGTILLTPKTVLDTRLALALNDVLHGNVHGPYKNAKAIIKALKQK